MSGNRKQEDIAREKYWNEEYVRYWKSRVEDANKTQGKASQMVEGDVKTTTDQIYLDAINLLGITKSDSVLEIGCGFGRSLNTLAYMAKDVCATDISEQMINAAKQACSEENVSFYVCPSEDLPFPDARFDVVVCFAAFDAMYQTEALIEMNRVSRPGAKLLLTGKNDDYHDGDKAALAAEQGARNKGHPNYFTDVKKLMDMMGCFGFKVEVQKFYRRRGDFSDGKASVEMPKRFYEYMFVLSKVSACTVGLSESISDKVSKTYFRQSKYL